jgi:hypothetical protein
LPKGIGTLAEVRVFSFDWQRQVKIARGKSDETTKTNRVSIISRQTGQAISEKTHIRLLSTLQEVSDECISILASDFSGVRMGIHRFDVKRAIAIG